MDLKKRNEEMRDFFNEKADGYDDVHLPMMANKSAIAENLPEGTSRVLNLGAGTGLELIPLFARFPQVRVTVVDISAEMLKSLRERDFIDRVDIICGDFFSVDFGAGYDAVISSAALHHFDESEKAQLYAKIHACMKMGGAFINSDRCLDTRAEQEERFREFYENGQQYRHYDTPLCADAERAILTEAGFSDIRVSELDGRYKLICARKLQ